MGQSESSFKRTYQETVAQLSSVQLGEIAARFNELYAKAGGPKGHLVDREAFSKYFHLPVAVGDRLFDAFDKQQNSKISFEEFVCGLAVVLHGSFSDKCQLLFRVFNLHGDEGISRAELTTMLTAIQASTDTILSSVGEAGGAVMAGEDRGQAVKRMVDSAFINCDISRSGKLLPLEFEYWLKRNPKILDNLLSFRTKADICTLGPLLMVPDEPLPADRTSSSQGGSGVLEVSREASPTSRTSFPRIGSVPVMSHAPLPRMSSGTLEVSHKVSPTHAPLPRVSSVPVIGNTTFTPVGSEVTEVGSEVAEVGSEVAEVGSEVAEVGSEVTEVGSEVVEVGSEVAEVVCEVTEVGSEVAEVSSEVGSKVTEVGIEVTEVNSEVAKVDSVVVEVDQPSDEPVVVAMEPSSPTWHMVATDPELSSSEESGHSESLPDGEGSGQGLAEEINVQTSPLVEGLVETPEETPEVKFTQGPPESDLSDYGGSIMLSEDDSVVGAMVLNLPIAPLPDIGISEVPSSPVLPTTTETIISLEQETETPPTGDQLEEDLLSFSSNELTDLEEDQLAGSSVLPSNFTESLPDVDPSPRPDSTLSPGPDTGPEPQQVVGGFEPEIAEALGAGLAREDKPERRPSPYPDGAAGVREALYTAWLPSARTQEMLANPREAAQHLTCPGLVADVKMKDPIGDLLSAHFPSAQRKPQLSVEAVSMDTEGLRRLVDAGCYHAALELTGRFLMAHGQGLGQAGQPSMNTHKTLQMWAARIALLVHLRMFKEAELETMAFGALDNPDLYYQYHRQSYPGKTGSMAPFSLRLLHAQIPSLTGAHQASLDRLCALQHISEQILSQVKESRMPWVLDPLTPQDQQIAETLWQERLLRIKFSIVNCFIAMQDYSMAVEVLEALVEQLPALRAELWSAIGRLFLQLGDAPSAQTYFSHVSRLAAEDPSKAAQAKINEALVHIFFTRWQSARESLDAAQRLEPDNSVLWNNIAVCAFFQGSLREAISQLEALLRSNPPISLQPGAFSNLAAAYDLETSSSVGKKLSLLPTLAEHVSEGFYLPALGVR